MKNRILSGILLAVLLLGCLAGCGGKNKRAVGTCAGYEVPYEELRYIVLSVRDLLAEKYETDDLSDHREEFEGEVLSRLADDYAVLAAAARYLPDRSPDDKDLAKRVDEAISEAVEAFGGKKEYKAKLKELYMTERLMRFHLAVAMIEEELADAVFAGTELESKAAFTDWLGKGNYVRVRQIFAHTEADARSISDAIRGGATPEEAVAGVSGAHAAPAGYLVRGLAEDPELETDAFALEQPGDLSAPRETVTEGGYQARLYRVLLRMENNEETFLEYQASAYRDRLRRVRLAETVAGFEAETTFEPNDYFRSLDLLAIK